MRIVNTERKTERLEFLKREIDVYETRNLQILLDQNYTPNSIEHDDRMAEYMNSIYEEFNKLCDESWPTYCAHCYTEFTHESSHRFLAEHEGWDTDHHQYLEDAGWDGCPMCPENCDLGDCGWY